MRAYCGSFVPLLARFGPAWGGLLGQVGFTLLNPNGTVAVPRAMSPVADLGNGDYLALVSFVGPFVGAVRWDNGAATPLMVTEELLIDPLPATPATPAAPASSPAIAAAVWDEPLARHLAAGSAGVALAAAATPAAPATPVSAAAVADAVWDELVAEHATPGSAGAELATPAVVVPADADPLMSQVPDRYPAGSAGAALGRLLGASVSVAGPLLPPSRLQLVQGDAYLAVDGRAIVVVRADGELWPPDLTGWSFSFEAERNVNPTSGQPPQTVAASSVTAIVVAGASQSVRIELASAVTGQLAEGANAYAWELVATSPDGGRQVTLRRGSLDVFA